jgi:tetratricopeptide (TPR) repeat protein
MAFDKVKAIRAAEKSLAQGKIPAAIQEYERIVGYEPDDFSALNTLGDLYARVEKRTEAAACYRRVAEHYREQGFTLKAVAMYKKLTRFDPKDHKIALALAALYEQQGLMVEARQQYVIAADAFSQSGETREALEVFRRIADLDPTNTQIRLRLADGYAKEKLPDLAAEAYTIAGERLASRREFEPALDAFVKALAFRPTSHPALHGVLSAHIALGTADEAAELLERAVRERPGDLELRAMLARAYVEAEDAAHAERASRELVTRDPSSFALVFDAVRLHLRLGSAEDATRLLVWATEPALAGRQESALAELAQEILARDREQLDAHRLLVRIYKSQHDNARLRSALESLADAADAMGDTGEERRALTRLLRLAPEEAGHRERLEELGGPLLDEEEEAARKAEAEAPTFESFMLDNNSTPPPAQQFDWGRAAANAAAAEHADASASFSDLNDLTDTGPAAEAHSDQPSGEQFPHADYNEFEFGMDVPAPTAPSEAAQSGGVEQMLRQEIESVDFYIEQGYADIASDTLDMLERQYGPHAEIEARRARIASGPAPVPVAEAGYAVAQEVGSVHDEPAVMAFTPEPQPAPAPQPSNNNNSHHASAAAQPQARAVTPGIDPGLAAIFDEFREAVEDSSEDEAGADFDTRYQMGLAYREMGLLDQAVEEFQAAAAMTAPGDGTPRFLQCCNLLGHCFMEKGLARPAAMWFKKGLDAPGHTEDEYQAMRYDLATAYEQMGDNDRAVEVLSEVYAINVSYRGVAERLRELQKASNTKVQ